MTQTAQYAPVLAKIGAERSKLLSENKLKALVESKSLTEFATQLRESTYQSQITKVPLQLSSRKLERAFNENLIETYIKIIKNSPKKAAKYLGLYVLRFEVENIKTLIKSVNAKMSPELRLTRIYFSAENFLKHGAVMEEAAKAPTLKQLVNAFKRTDYASALEVGLQSYEENASTTCLDVLLDKVYYEKLCSSYANLHKTDKPHALFYASMENDGFTLLTLLRGKNLNYDANWLRLAVPPHNFSLSAETVEEMVSSVDFESAQKIVLSSCYARYFVKAQSPEETIINAEKAFRKAVFQHAKESRIGESFNVGAALVFMVQKEVEVHNLVAASVGVEAGIKPEAIESQLLL